MRATPFPSFLVQMTSSMTANVRHTGEKRRHLRNPRCPLAGSDSPWLQFKPAICHLSSNLPMQTHQLQYSASRTSFSDTIAHRRTGRHFTERQKKFALKLAFLV